MLSRFLCIVAAFASVEAISFKLDPGSTRCLRQELTNGTFVKGDFKASVVEKQSVQIEIKDDYGRSAYTKENADSGKIAYVADNAGVYETCFTSKVDSGAEMKMHEITVDLKSGVEANEYDAVKEAENLAPLELAIRRMEELAESIAKDMGSMKQREANMRNTNESTNARVLYFSVVSMMCLVGLAIWQVYYLKSYFKSKKLI
ncbi:hypothetical protein SARC_05711 [Sphaeroforma arctica JP610]|uniref:GOLD domain-containing protein n=1 Tax=Sphaeroforma arctica JP610 TaxID=667725 RepID=A0A0L0G1B6_9EUKA|nr:hypothetical protein SARC_05711 [Sphaeroforma arctica JP610]KNC81998.1 hypothetical protein SARC_05711 [Sphaeroforma arctica JP610]|eukprot:XP_014155900.1 hypothetical protein SARC_05711 [Sphaeroforma arctica JP610]